MFKLWNMLTGEVLKLPAGPGVGSGPGGEESLEEDLRSHAEDCCRFVAGAGFVCPGVVSGPALP